MEAVHAGRVRAASEIILGGNGRRERAATIGPVHGRARLAAAGGGAGGRRGSAGADGRGAGFVHPVVRANAGGFPAGEGDRRAAETTETDAEAEQELRAMARD